MNERILVVDDEAWFRQALVVSLEGRGYVVQESATGREAIADFESFQPDVILLDLMLPDTDGVTVCRELRRRSSVPIIVLSVMNDEVTKVRALDQGADDYLTKPFGSDELLARIRATVRRTQPPESLPAEAQFGSLWIDYERRRVFLEGTEVRLTPTEFSLLRLLTENAGRVLRHPAILQAIWGPGYESDTQILRTFINQLRMKLNDPRQNPRFIRTEPGVGYRFLIPGE